jgi:hypothetical protein
LSWLLESIGGRGLVDLHCQQQGAKLKGNKCRISHVLVKIQADLLTVKTPCWPANHPPLTDRRQRLHCFRVK